MFPNREDDDQVLQDYMREISQVRSGSALPWFVHIHTVHSFYLWLILVGLFLGGFSLLLFSLLGFFNGACLGKTIPNISLVGSLFCPESRRFILPIICFWF